MKTAKYVLVVFLFFVFKTALAQDGILDLTFNNTGILLPNYGSLESENMFLRVQSDGRLITLETVSAHGSNPQYYLKRYDSSALRDFTFGAAGQVVSNYTTLTPRALGLDLQSDGKILVAGNLSGAGGGAFIARYTVDGQEDSSFGTSGTLIIPSDSWPSSFTTLIGGKMLITYAVAGTPKLARINSNGTLDTTFGSGGSVNILSLGKLAVQPDGKIILAGGSTDFVFTRYLNNGALDTSYGVSGTFTLNVGDYDYLSSVGMQSDGKLVFLGQSTNSATNAQSTNLVRLTSSGGLDSSFGTGGKILLPFTATTLEFQDDGKIVASGNTVSSNSWNKIEVARFLSNGTLDTSFGTGGITITSLGDNVGVSPSDIKVGADGRIYVGGTFCEAFLSCHPHSFATRYTTKQLSVTDFVANKNAFTVYPNPVNQIVNVDFNLAQQEVLSIDLLDINGRKISTLINNESFQMGFSSQQLQLPESLSRGLYFLNISDGKNMTTVKISK